MTINILAFDTATEACSVALQVGDRFFSRHQIAPRQHATLLLPMIHDVLREAKIALQDLHAIAFGCGPGSFMGVRFATGVAQGLALGLQKPVIPVSTLQTLAQTACRKKNIANCLVGWDARMGGIYWGFYQADDTGMMQPTIADQLSLPETFDMLQLPAVGFALAGNAWTVYKDKLPQVFSSSSEFFVTDCYPDAQAMLLIAHADYLLGKTMPPENARPHYVRDRVVHYHSE